MFICRETETKTEMRNCYTKCIQTSDLIVFVRNARARFFIFLFPNHRTIILLRKIRYFSIRIHSHATMATPAVRNICANFEEVGQVREQAHAFQIQFFPLSPSVSLFLFPTILTHPTQHAFLFSPPFLSLSRLLHSTTTNNSTATARNSVLSTTKPTPC